jgi:RNA polymerase sigma factor FliA
MTRDELILGHQYLVRSIAMNVHAHLPQFVEMDDLIGAGMIGLVSAASRYDKEKGVSFPNYAKARIRGEILDSLRRTDFLGRQGRQWRREIDQAIQSLESELEQRPTEDQIAERIGITVEVLRTRLDLTDAHCVSYDAPMRLYEKGAWPDDSIEARNVLDPTESLEATAIRNQGKAILRRLIRGMRFHRRADSSRYAHVIDLYYWSGLTLKQIGTELGVQESRVSQMHKTALARLRSGLTQLTPDERRCMAVLDSVR